QTTCMTRLEFTLKNEEMFRKRASRAWWLVPLLVGVPAAKWVGLRFGNSAEFGASALLLAFFAWAIWAEVRLRRKLGLLCPNCSRPFDAAASAHAWLTGNCKHCGKLVFDDRPDALNCESRLTKQEFTSRLEAETRRVHRRGKRWLVAAGAIIAAFLPLAW